MEIPLQGGGGGGGSQMQSSFICKGLLYHMLEWKFPCKEEEEAAAHSCKAGSYHRDILDVYIACEPKPTLGRDQQPSTRYQEEAGMVSRREKTNLG
jgi:hypothetical protein